MPAISRKTPCWCGSHKTIPFECRSDRAVDEGKLVGPQVGVISLDVGVVTHVAGTRGGKREEVGAKPALVGLSVFPKRSSGFPIRAKTFVVRHGILNDKRLDTLRVRQGHAKAYRSAVILHV